MAWLSGSVVNIGPAKGKSSLKLPLEEIYGFVISSALIESIVIERSSRAVSTGGKKTVTHS